MDTVAPPSRPIILFTAFEPSGDALAAPVVRELRQRDQTLDIRGCGGPLMEAAGAELLARSATDGAMGASAWRRAGEVRRIVRQLKRFSREHRVVVHVPVDSPAANFPICSIFRKHGARTVHLVAPQLWAWGRSRIAKLRRRTDLVLCLLPFEEPWFKQRGVPARFIGHPAVNRNLDEQSLKEQMHGLPGGAPRVAILPGSRSHEVRANIGLLVAAFSELQARHAGLAGVIVAASRELASLVRRRIRVFPTGLHMIVDQVDPVIAWCDLALAVSGTITLHVARHRKPMVGVYRTSAPAWLLSKLVLRTRYRLLPNIIAEREIVPEFVPHAGRAGPIVREASAIFQDSRNAALQSESLRRICLRFAHKQPGREAADEIMKYVGEGLRD